jgi:hypothetical protein
MLLWSAAHAAWRICARCAGRLYESRRGREVDARPSALLRYVASAVAAVSATGAEGGAPIA